MVDARLQFCLHGGTTWRWNHCIQQGTKILYGHCVTDRAKALLDRTFVLIDHCVVRPPFGLKDFKNLTASNASDLTVSVANGLTSNSKQRERSIYEIIS